MLTLDGICHEYAVSRSVAREAIRVLESMGLVASRRRVGITIQPRHKWNVFDPRVIRWRLDEGDRTEQLLSLSELRRGIEPVAAALAAAAGRRPPLPHPRGRGLRHGRARPRRRPGRLPAGRHDLPPHPARGQRQRDAARPRRRRGGGAQRPHPPRDDALAAEPRGDRAARRGGPRRPPRRQRHAPRRRCARSSRRPPPRSGTSTPTEESYQRGRDERRALIGSGRLEPCRTTAPSASRPWGIAPGPAAGCAPGRR